MERCDPCQNGRRDGKPCDITACKCRCHREGTQAVEALQDATLDKARESRPYRRVGPNSWAGKVQIEIREFLEESDEKLRSPEEGK